MSKASSLMKNAQIEKTRQTVQELVQWFPIKEEFYKTYFPVQQIILKQVYRATEITLTRLKQIAQVVKDEREMQAAIHEKCEKNTLNNDNLFAPKEEEIIDSNGQKTKVQQPVWSSNVDRIFLSFGKHQKDKQNQTKKIYKTLEAIHDSISKE